MKKIIQFALVIGWAIVLSSGLQAGNIDIRGILNNYGFNQDEAYPLEDKLKAKFIENLKRELGELGDEDLEENLNIGRNNQVEGGILNGRLMGILAALDLNNQAVNQAVRGALEDALMKVALAESKKEESNRKPVQKYKEEKDDDIDLSLGDIAIFLSQQPKIFQYLLDQTCSNLINNLKPDELQALQATSPSFKELIMISGWGAGFKLDVLTDLDVSGLKVTDQDLRIIVKLFPSLQSLNLSNTKVTGESLKIIGKLTQLRTLNISGMILVTDEDLSNLRHLRQLQYLYLSSELKIIAETLEILCVSLKELQITWTTL